MSTPVRVLLVLAALAAGAALAVLLAVWLYQPAIPPRVINLREINDVIAEAIHIARDAAQ